MGAKPHGTGQHVEARSLASLNHLAANPPQYPKKPTEARQDPIVLYISRVPGTRDIILSTQKPQVKNVTAEDIASSLYYVHLNVPEDEVLVPPSQTKPPTPSRSSEESINQIQRKPVPGKASSILSRVEDGAPQVPSGNENEAPVGVRRYSSMRKPVPTSSSAQPPTQTHPAPHLIPPHGAIPRKPLGPRSESPRKTPPSIRSFEQSPAYQPPPSDEQPPPLPARPGEVPTTAQPKDPSAPYADKHPPSSPKKRRPFTPFSLTLIRRDPSSGQQWNVGKVASFQLENPDLIHDEKHQQQPSPSIIIHLETSGYAKFRGMPTHPGGDIRASLDVRPGSASSAMHLNPLDIPVSVSASGAFERQVVMAYSRSFAENLRQKIRRLSPTSDEERPDSPLARMQQGRRKSVASMASFGGEFDGGPGPVITQPAPGLKRRGYTFYSPWGGRCEFVTGNAGRSLRCRHVLPTYGGAVFNPLVDGPEEKHAEDRAKKTQLISELRFNLPSNELLFVDKRSPEGRVRTRDHLQSQFNKVIQKTQGCYDDDSDDEFHFDMSLGREKAGGGNRGKRAKMGKLIVCEEGLKMLDLAVAANVGVWWTVWERTADRGLCDQSSPSP
ncbi:hypothetical protein F4779DRAFT_607767 [Xylariaceae sp. FL0662B]|nr:hypothetical protein F4779DRAFT_607767 [Xylariaceae sp. FL0662B]